MANMTDFMANTVANAPDIMANGNSTYRYRDSEKRRAYMREYMRKRRGGV